MFKLIFRTISLTLFITILITGLAIWKGGEPFIWVGKKIEAAGKTIIRFGHVVDDLRYKKKQVETTIKRLKDVVAPEENKVSKQPLGDDNEAIDTDNKSE
jgi:hypothetical protein